MHKVKRLFFVFTIICLCYFLYQIDGLELVYCLQQIRWSFILVLGLTAVAYFFATLAWKYSFSSITPNIKVLLIIRHIGEMLSIVNPGNVLVGDSLKVHYLQQIGVEKPAGLSSVFISRFLMILSFFILSIFLIWISLSTIHFFQDQLWKLPLLCITLFTCFYIVLKFQISHRLYLFNLAKKISQVLPSSFSIKRTLVHIKECNYRIIHFYGNQKRDVFLVLFYSSIHWLLGAVEFFIILQAFQFDIRFSQAVALELGVVTCKSFAAFIPGQIGVEELSSKLILEMIGISDGEIWLAVAMVRRARQVFWIAVAFLLYKFFNAKNYNHENSMPYT